MAPFIHYHNFIFRPEKPDRDEVEDWRRNEGRNQAEFKGTFLWVAEGGGWTGKDNGPGWSSVFVLSERRNDRERKGSRRSLHATLEAHSGVNNYYYDFYYHLFVVDRSLLCTVSSSAYSSSRTCYLRVE